MLTIDGAAGEGGGQIVRSALALSILTARPVRIEHVRAGRRRPGLQRQHLTAVRAAATVSRGSRVEGAELGSQQLTFHPGTPEAGAYHFDVGSAGSSTLVLQTVLPALLQVGGRSTLVLEGGTHNPLAPPFDFLAHAFLPLLGRMGGRVEVRLERTGFYPAGGGRVTVAVEPSAAGLIPLELHARGALVRRHARAVTARLPRTIAQRELRQVQQQLGWSAEELEAVEVSSAGPGNALMLTVQSEQVTEVFTAFGERGVPAERVADLAARAARRYLERDAPVGEHLADQLLLPLAVAGGGSFRTLDVSRHARTNIEVIGAFLDVEVTTRELGHDDWIVDVRRR